jgi:tetratricopeptide (TPR) repeat protein
MKNLSIRILSDLTLAAIVSQLSFQGLELRFMFVAQAQSMLAQNAEIEKLIEQSDNQVDQGQPQAGLQTLERALSRAKALRDLKNEGVILHRFGSIYLYSFKDFQRARNYYQQALENAQALPNPILEGKALINLGNTYKNENNLQQSIVLHQKALAVTQKSGDCYVQSVAEEALAYDYLPQSLSQSTRFLENAAATIRSCEKRSFEIREKTIKQEAVILNSLGRNYFILHTFEAVSSPKHCLPTPSEKKSATPTPCLDRGTRAYQRAINLATQIEDEQLAATARKGLMDIYKLQKSDTEAQGVLEKIVQDLRKFKANNLTIAKTLASLVEVYSNTKQWSKVKETGNEALLLLQKPTNNFEDKVETQNYQSQVFMSFGDAARQQLLYPEAIQEYQRTAEIAHGLLAQLQAENKFPNQDWIRVQSTIARQRLNLACLQLRGMFAISGQPDKSPEICQSRQP